MNVRRAKRLHTIINTICKEHPCLDLHEFNDALGLEIQNNPKINLASFAQQMRFTNEDNITAKKILRIVNNPNLPIYKKLEKELSANERVLHDEIKKELLEILKPVISPPSNSPPSINASSSLPAIQSNPKAADKIDDPVVIFNLLKSQSNGEHLKIEDVQSFLARGGEFRIVSARDKNSNIHISKKDTFIVGCTSGINRSQVLRHVLAEQNGLNVHPMVLAGGDTLVNPFAKVLMPIQHTPDDLGYQSFYHAFGCNKVERFMGEEFEINDVIYDLDLNSKKNQIGNKQINNNDLNVQFNALDVNHFMCFACSGPSVLVRSLAKKGSLQGTKITFLDHGDTIAHPAPGIEPHSREAYVAFADDLRQRIVTT